MCTTKLAEARTSSHVQGAAVLVKQCARTRMYMGSTEQKLKAPSSVGIQTKHNLKSATKRQGCPTGLPTKQSPGAEISAHSAPSQILAWALQAFKLGPTTALHLATMAPCVVICHTVHKGPAPAEAAECASFNQPRYLERRDLEREKAICPVANTERKHRKKHCPGHTQETAIPSPPLPSATYCGSASLPIRLIPTFHTQAQAPN
mmetsp:Transcript_27675/g.70486  ORF Transcript_27675/g.70486 Transcript_27675/m.70486 type:complete len:205 (+) Transcript_27675:162-776(+)